MDEFGFEPHHAQVAARVAGAAGAEGAGAEAAGDAVRAAQSSQRTRPSTSLLQRLSTREMPRPKAPQASAQHAAKSAADGSLQVRARADAEETVPLPQAFTAQYLGARPAGGLWGVRHTRRPVDELVAAARSSGAPLPFQRLRVSVTGVDVSSDSGAGGRGAIGARLLRHHDISAISYGVQDLVYTRVFCFIVVSEQRGAGQLATAPGAPPVFQCHAYVCESRAAARALTHALAAAFRAYSKELVTAGPGAPELAKKRFMIDLRSPEQLAADLATNSDECSDA